MNVTTKTTELKDHHHGYTDTNPDLFDISIALGERCGINLDQNCTLGELEEMLDEIEIVFEGDLELAMTEIQSGRLTYEEIVNPNPKIGGLMWRMRAQLAPAAIQ